MRLNTSVPAGYCKEAPGQLPGRLSIPGWEVHRIAALVIDRRPLPSFFAENAGTYRLGSLCGSGSLAKQSAKFRGPGTVSPPERGTREDAAALLHLGQFEI